MLKRYVAGLEPYVPTMLRLVVGITFLLHGLLKFQNMARTIVEFGRQGVLLPQLVAPLVSVVEVVGGLLLIVGLLTRPVAILLAIDMIYAILIVKSLLGYIAPVGHGAGAELDTLLLAGCLALLVLGAGQLSIERNILKREL